MQGLIDPSGNVKTQYHWDPYGELLAADLALNVPRNRVGHQGLFVDRLDGATTQLQFARNAAILYQNRNRTYAPALGRFLQRDPNGTGVLLVSALTARRSGDRLRYPAALSVERHYVDGLSAFAYVRSSPYSHCDPFGTEEFSLSGVLANSAAQAQINAMRLAGASAAGLSSLVASFNGAASEELDEVEAEMAAMETELSVAWYRVADALGKIGEFAAGIVKNTERITINGMTRIPDVLDKSAKLIGEVKNTSVVAYTEQLEDYVTYAQQMGYRFELIIRESAEVSGTLERLQSQGVIDIIRKLPW